MAVPPTASVGEGGGMIQVCATLSVTGGGTTAGDIDIMLATSDGKLTSPITAQVDLAIIMTLQNLALRW